ncbi:MAG: FmdB family zinc ribbon protein [Thermodesulfobacteriota bacterium]
MPIYEYKCKKCGKEFEMMQKFSDAPLTKCIHCTGKVEKLISQSSFALKGSGWYATDYAQKGKEPKGEKPEACAVNDKDKKPSCDGCPSS